MRNTVQKQSNTYPVPFAALVILPAILLGVLAMIAGKEPPVLWGQQLAAWLILAFLAWLLRRFAVRIPAYVWDVLLLLLLAASLLGQGTDGVRRWLDLGVAHVNATMLVLPAILVVLCRVKKPYLVLIAAAAVVCFQPDLSQLTAFCAAALPLIWKCGTKRILQEGITVCLCILLRICLSVQTVVPPVPYTEGILSMLGNISGILVAVGWIALLLIPLFFVFGYYKKKSRPLLCLALYYTVTILFILDGHYPVPFMGFGLSPIAGYWLAYAVMVPEKDKDDPERGAAA